MEENRYYTMTKSRWKRSVLEGCRMTGTGAVLLDEKRLVRRLFLCRLDNGGLNRTWGRLCVEGEFPKESVVNVWAVMSDNKETVHFSGMPEASFYKEHGLLCAVNQPDVLLPYRQGRYLWLFIEIIGYGRGVLTKVRVQSPGNTLLQALPEVYRENAQFLRRYLAIYENLDEDFRSEPDTAEYPGREEMKKKLELNYRKGTKAGVIQAAKLEAAVQVAVAEREDGEVLVFIDGEQETTDAERLFRILEGYIPAGARWRLKYTTDPAYLDDAGFLDMGIPAGPASHMGKIGASQLGLCCMA